MVFVPLKNLENLSLVNNRLRGISKILFVGLKNIKSVEVRGNDDFHLSRETFESRSRLLLKVDGGSGWSHGHRYYSQLMLLCIKEGIVTSLEHAISFENLWTASQNCSVASLIANVFGEPFLQLTNYGITGFQQGWYGINNDNINSLELMDNNITILSTALLNGLPNQKMTVTLNGNPIESIEKGIVHRNPIGLSLAGCSISEIEDNAFQNVTLTSLGLGNNKLTNLNFVPTLPATLRFLYLGANGINQIPYNIFSHLDALRSLSLSGNDITSLNKGVFDDLKELRTLDISKNGITSLDVGMFARLKELRTLDISGNGITSLNEGVFDGLGQLQDLDIHDNHITSLTRASFRGLSNEFTALNIKRNLISKLNTGTFPDSIHWLRLAHNKIMKIEEGTFGPEVRYLFLNDNSLVNFDPEIFNGLSKLKLLELRSNLFGPIDEITLELLRSYIGTKATVFHDKANSTNTNIRVP